MAKTYNYKTRIYYEDTDAGGIVYYANYLKYFERARTEWIYALGFDHNKLDKSDILIVVRSCNIDYEKSVKFEEEIEIRVKGNVELAIVDRAGKPKKMPEDLYKSFKSCI